MILIEIKIEARYLNKNSQTPQKKTRENLNLSNSYGFWANNLMLFSWTGPMELDTYRKIWKNVW